MKGCLENNIEREGDFIAEKILSKEWYISTTSPRFPITSMPPGANTLLSDIIQMEV